MWFLLPLFIFLWAAPGQATVYFNETFDDGESAIESRWDASCGAQWLRSGVFSLDSSQQVSGTTSMKEVVNGLTTRTPEYLGGTCYIDKEFFPTQTLFVRWYERTQAGFIYDASNVKNINFGSYYHPSWWVGHWDGSHQLNLVGQVVADNNYENPTYYHNKTPMIVPEDRWICVEVQLTVNTPGQNDGLLRQWQDGVLVAEYSNQTFVGPNALNGPDNNNNSHMKFTLVRMFAQHGVGTRWFDNWAAADTKIGCTEPLSDDLPPSSPPTGLTLR